MKLSELKLDGPASALLIMVCCVCRTYLGSKDGEGTAGESHTYCPACFEQQMLTWGSYEMRTRVRAKDGSDRR